MRWVSAITVNPATTLSAKLAMDQQYRAAETETIPEMEKLIDWLPKNMPEDDGVFH